MKDMGLHDRGAHRGEGTPLAKASVCHKFVHMNVAAAPISVEDPPLFHTNRYTTTGVRLWVDYTRDISIASFAVADLRYFGVESGWSLHF